MTDNTITKFIRPTVVIWLTLLFTVLTIIDGNFFNITIKEVYVTVLESIMMVAYGSYFIGRSYEKGKSIISEDTQYVKDQNRNRRYVEGDNDVLA